MWGLSQYRDDGGFKSLSLLKNAPLGGGGNLFDNPLFDGFSRQGGGRPMGKRNVALGRSATGSRDNLRPLLRRKPTGFPGPRGPFQDSSDSGG